MLNIKNFSLYFLNSLVLISGLILFSYYSDTEIHNKTLVELNCDQTYFLSFMALINSILSLLTIEYFKYIGFVSTLSIFSYNSYNMEYISSKCILNGNIVWLYYLYCIIINGINIFIYLFTFLDYIRIKKFNKINVINDDNIEHNLMYDVNNESVNGHTDKHIYEDF
jgi:hypothetical protein